MTHDFTGLYHLHVYRTRRPEFTMTAESDGSNIFTWMASRATSYARVITTVFGISSTVLCLFRYRVRARLCRKTSCGRFE